MKGVHVGEKISLFHKIDYDKLVFDNSFFLHIFSNQPLLSL